MKIWSVTKRVALFLMVASLAVATVACQGAAGVPGEPGEPGQPGAPGEPGAPADPVLQPPYVVQELPDLPALVQGMQDMVDLTDAFGDPDGTVAALTLGAKSTDPAIATASVSGTTLTVDGVGVGTTSVVVTATDADDLKVSQSVQVTVIAAPPEPDPPVTIDDVKAKYPTLVITPTTAADASMEIELPADHTLISANQAVVTVAKKAAAAPPASSIRWASATADDTMAKNVWVVTAVSAGITDVDVLDTSKASVHTIRVTVTDNPPPPPVPPVAPTYTQIPKMTLFQAEGAQTVDLAMYFQHVNGSAITYATPSSSPPGIVTAAIAAGTLTLTPVVPGSTTVAVVAMAEGLSVRGTFIVEVTADSKPVPPTPVPPVAPTRTAEIDDMTLYKDDGAADPIDLSDHFTHEMDIMYDVSSSPPGIVKTAVAKGMLTLTPLVRGETIVTVTATVAGKKATDMFTVNVMAGSEEPDTEPDPTPDTSPPELIFDDEEKQTINIAGYIPDDADPADYHLDPEDEDVVTAEEKGDSDSEWEIEPGFSGETTIAVIETANGDEVNEITVEVMNRSPDFADDAPKNPTTPQVITETGEAIGPADDEEENLNRDGNHLLLYMVELENLDKFFRDPDWGGEDEELTYEISTSHRAVQYHQAEKDCVYDNSVTECEIYLDFTMIPDRINSFHVSVKLMDKDGEMSEEVEFPFYFPSEPASQTYTVSQRPANDSLRGITVGERRGVAHTVNFRNPEVTDDAENAFAVTFIGTNDTKYAMDHGVTVAGTPTPLIAASDWATIPTTFDGKKPGAPTGTPDDTGTVRTIVIASSGAVEAVEHPLEGTTEVHRDDFSTSVALAANVGERPVLGLKVKRAGSGTVTIQEWAWWDRDTLAVTAAEIVASWHMIAERSFSVTVR